MNVGTSVTRLGELTWPEVRERAAGLLAVPVGSTEQHGPHLPLSTDTDVAVALADALAARRGDVVVAPALPYGSSGEHDGFPGTLSIGREAVAHVLVELGRSASATFDRVLFVSAHGGNAVPVADAVRLLRAEGRDVRAWSPSWRGDAHAGHTETSVQLALGPDRVHLHCAAAGATEDVAVLMPALARGGVRAVSANGVLGDPSTATAGEGRRLLASALDDLAGFTARWATP
jgi:mycofactocin system creatininase family protein